MIIPPTMLPIEHPLRQSQWVWPDVYMYQHNHFAQFRWDIDLLNIADCVPLYITADKSYRLFVNGKSVCRGPARGYQSHWPYDEVDLAPSLQPGHNWISVEAYQPGCSTFQYLHQNYSGLLVATSDAPLRAAMAFGQFAMRRSPGHRRDTARYSYQIDFQEHLDLRLDDRSWIDAPQPPQGWRPDIFPDIAQKMRTIPFGRPPYDTVEPRGIPLLHEKITTLAMPTATATGDSNAGYATALNVSWHWVAEGRAIACWDDATSIDVSRSETSLSLILTPTGIGKFRAVVIPVGHYTLGNLIVETQSAVGGEILDFQHDQFSRDGMAHFVEPGDGSIVALANRLILRPGRNRHEFYHPLGFGSLTLIARDLTKPLKLKLAVRTIGYPFKMNGGFECSDVTLNTIHAASRRTQQLCAIDAYIDTPWREQAQWWGDARVQAKNTFYLDGDARLLARGIRSVAAQNVLGLTPGHAPTSSFFCVLPDFALTWILTVWDYYWQTGDFSLFCEQYQRISEVLAYFNTTEARHPGTGLLRHDSRFWLFEDWADLPKCEVPTFLNLWYVLTLRHVAKLCEVSGKIEDWHRWLGIAAVHEALIICYCFDPLSGMFCPALKDDGARYGPPSVHDQTIALMLGLMPDAQVNMLEKSLLPYLRGESTPGAMPSAFWSTYVLEEAIARGHAAEAVAFIRNRWQPMLSTGTTWEHFKWNEESSASACHAWSAHPCFHLVNGIAGIIQTQADWAEIRLAPDFLTHIDYARATIPSSRGLIDIEWRRTNNTVCGRLSAPASIRVVSTIILQQSADRDLNHYDWKS